MGSCVQKPVLPVQKPPENNIPNQNSEQTKNGALVLAPKLSQAEQFAVEKRLEKALFSSSDYSFTHDESFYLRASFEILLRDKEKLAIIIYQRIIQNIPDAIPKFQQSVRYNDKWEHAAVILNFLSGLERCLLRMDRRAALYEFVKRMTQEHSRKKLVPGIMIRQALVQMQEAMLQLFDVMPLEHFPEWPASKATTSEDDSATFGNNNNNEDEASRSKELNGLLWKKFFGMLTNLVLIAELSQSLDECSSVSSSTNSEANYLKSNFQSISRD